MKVKQPSVPAGEPVKNGLQVNGNCAGSDKKADLKNDAKSKKKKAKESKKANKRAEEKRRDSKIKSDQNAENNQNVNNKNAENIPKSDSKSDLDEYIDREKYPLRVKASPFKFDLNKEPQTIDEMLKEINKLLKNFLLGNVVESKQIFYQRAHLSFFYEIICCSFDFLDSLLKLDREHLEIALHSVTACNATANKLRKQRGLIGYLIRGDFSQHTDMELYAEAAHSFTQVLNGFIVALLDQVGS